MQIEKQWWNDRIDIKPELNDAPIMENHSDNIKNSDWIALHDSINELVLEFFKKHGLPINAFSISYVFDDLKSSVDFGEPTPVSDSDLVLFDISNKAIITSM